MKRSKLDKNVQRYLNHSVDDADKQKNLDKKAIHNILEKFQSGHAFNIIDGMYEDQLGETDKKLWKCDRLLNEGKHSSRIPQDIANLKTRNYENREENHINTLNIINQATSTPKIPSKKLKKHLKSNKMSKTPTAYSKTPKQCSKYLQKLYQPSNAKLNSKILRTSSKPSPNTTMPSIISDSATFNPTISFLPSQTSFCYYNYKKRNFIHKKGTQDPRHKKRMVETQRVLDQVLGRERGRNGQQETTHDRMTLPLNIHTKSTISNEKSHKKMNKGFLKKGQKSSRAKKTSRHKEIGEDSALKKSIESISNSLPPEEINERSKLTELKKKAKSNTKSTGVVLRGVAKPRKIQSVRYQNTLRSCNVSSGGNKMDAVMKDRIKSKMTLPISQNHQHRGISGIEEFLKMSKRINSSKFITKSRILKLGTQSTSPNNKTCNKEELTGITEYRTLKSQKRSLNEIERSHLEKNKVFCQRKSREVQRIQDMCKAIEGGDQPLKSRITKQMILEGHRQDKLNATMNIISKLEGTPAFLLKKFYDYRVETLEQEKEFAQTVRQQYKSSIADPSRPVALKEKETKNIAEKVPKFIEILEASPENLY
ncbi:unnamed protein product [Moneuplotes crassus]|uniref:Uncharacterized protein n=1 Tax=Euplotes crassus TaxID=5936 RepID=A0AAD1X471_EUPCR|nr:unnamed protein product [Moneuplotes crassus]